MAGIYTNDFMIRKVLDYYFKGKKKEIIADEIKNRIMELLKILVPDNRQWKLCQIAINTLNYDELLDLTTVLNNTTNEGDRRLVIQRYFSHKICFGEVTVPSDATMITFNEIYKKSLVAMLKSSSHYELLPSFA